MHIKRFRGKTLEEALKGVKATFGEDAVILSTKKGNGLAEVLAAVDFDIEEIEEGVTGSRVVENRLNDLRAELSDIKHLFSSVVKDTAIKDLINLEGGALRLYQEMVASGVHERLSESIIRMASTSKNGGDLKDRWYRVVKENIDICNPLAGGERPRILAFVGPTGVGKTMTIAKLAGRLRQRYKAKVGLVSIDNTRPGANEVLKSYGDTFGLSLEILTTKKGFNKAVWNNKDKDIVLIDTPGRNPKDTNAIIELKEILNGGLPIKTGLVLSVTSRDENLFSACKGFGVLPIDCLVFTKIDEVHSCSYGSILNTLAFMKKPAAYLCSGQRVPEDIEAASQDVIGNLVLGGGRVDA